LQLLPRLSPIAAEAAAAAVPSVRNVILWIVARAGADPAF
jgi:hypothetical protein